MADNFNLRSFLTENKLTKNAKLLKEGSDYGFEEVMDAIADDFVPGTPEFEQMENAVQDAFHNGQVDTSEFGHDPSAPSREMRAIAKELGLDEAKEEAMEEASSEDMAYTEKVAEALAESKLTAKERRLVEMVNNAMGIQEEEHEFGTNAVTGEPLPNPNDNMVAEDEMVQDKPLPKYESIEELMKEIEHGTNEAAHKYKMDEMKRVYEALEAKVGSLEEGEHAEHIDQKAVKQMRKDIAALRKAEEKLRKEFDKKFSGKEKKATPAKEKATEALQENIMENFNLKKFLVENKLTTSSRMISENGTYTQKEILRGSMQGFKAPNPEELKVDMMIAPNMSYGDNQELLNQQMGRITAISGDKVTYKKGDGKLYNSDVADIIIVAS
jgi:hypothetical protein